MIVALIALIALCFLELTSASVAFGNLTVPDVFVLGAAKSGTTTLYAALKQHPEFCTNNTKKELQFFNERVDTGLLRWNYGLQWYADCFKNPGKCNGRKYLLDATPEYLRDMGVPDRVRSSYQPDELLKKKFIIVLREPVAREFSWYGHMMRICLAQMHRYVSQNKPKPVVMDATNRTVLGYRKEELCVFNHCGELGCSNVPEEQAKDLLATLDTFDQHVYHMIDVVHHDSAYAKLIRNWLRVIKREQLFVINSETLQTHPADTMKRVAQFLGLATDWGDNFELPHENSGHDFGGWISCRMHDKLQEYYAPLNLELYDLVNNGAGKPPSEPFFPPFTSSRHICKGH